MFSPAGVSVGGRIPYPKRGTYLLHVQNGYKANPIVAACVGLLSSTMNEPPLGVANEDGTVNLNHPLSVMFRRPNPYMGQAQFWAQCWQFLSLSGNAYIKIVRGPMGNMTGFLPYGDAHVAPIRDENGWIVGYQYSSQGITQNWSAADLIHLRHPLYIDPLALDMGMSPIEVCWDKVQTYNELQSSIYSLVASNMVPSGILTAPGDVPTSQVQQIKQQLTKRRDAKGKERTEPMVLGSGMTYVQMGLDAQRLQATETLRELEAAICAAFRIQPAVIGSSAGMSISTYNNLQSAFSEYTTLLRVPLWNAIEEQMESGLARDYPGVQLAFDTSQVQALQPDVDAVVYPAIASFNANLTTQNETRAKIGYEPLQDGDKFMYEVVPQMVGFGMASASGGTGQKIADAKTIVIVDIDDTLLRDGQGIEKNVAFVNDLGKTYRIEIVSGRPDSRRASTENELRGAGVQWNGLHLNDTTAPAIDFKKYKAGLLLKEYSVHLAIDNDADTRDMYSALGISVKNPATIPDTAENKNHKAPYDTIDFSPPQGVRDEAAKGLEWRDEYDRGGTEVGVARARDLSNGRNISPETAQRMASYFARHEVDKQGIGWEPGQDGFPSAGRIAWALWGGDAGQTWANKLVRQMTAEDESKTSIAGPLEMKFEVAGDRIKWDEMYAVKSWQDEERILKQSVSETEPFVVDLLNTAKRDAEKKARSGRGNPADGIKVEQLLQKYMTATKATRDKLAKRIIEMTVTSANVDFAAVESVVDEIVNVQTRETSSMIKDSCETLKREVSDIAEKNAGDVDAITKNISEKFERITPSRAATIARTTVRAQSTVVQNETVKQLNTREPDANKQFVMVWLTQRDSDVRPSHEEMDGKYIDIGGTWTQYNSGITKGPGIGPDPAEVINCRCVQRPTRKTRLGTLR